ncbi:MAG: PEP-CTERM sorting domain-containing protein [Verrucomicrobiota bacterium]|nr:PEP-CTERM sorting domain-containing protein [Verrucomicrobiota bacterium]
MKFVTKILVAFFAVSSASLHALSLVTATYGSASSVAGASTFADGWGIPFSDSNPGVLALGWSDGFDDIYSTSGILEDFNMLGWTNFNDVFAPGFKPAEVTFDNDVENAAGKEGYWLLMSGISDFSQASNAFRIGIFNDDDWEVAPVGSFLGDSWATAQVGNVDNVIYGSQVASGGFGAGTQFRTAPTILPEPSSYALLLGSLALGLVALRRR